MMHLKIYKAYRKVVALCDGDLIGKKFVDGEKQLDVKESFYTGEVLEKDKIIHILKCEAADDSTFNIVGKESIACAIEAGIIDKGGVLKLQNVPFAFSLL